VTAIEAAAVVPAPRDAVFGFLSELENHWALEERFELVRLTSSNGDAPDGGRVRIRGPLGMGRTAFTRVVSVEPPARLAGTATLGRRTRAEVSWTLSDARGCTTLVRLSAVVAAAGPLDRLLLAVGGRAWLERRFAALLARLSERLAGAVLPEDERIAASGG
jgi:hypothetical protein